MRPARIVRVGSPRRNRPVTPVATPASLPLRRADRAHFAVRGAARVGARAPRGAPEGGAPRRGVFGWLVRSGVRRVAALLVLALLAVSRAEALVAEVHDGDATHAELVQVDGAGRHGAAHGAGHHDDASHTSRAGAAAGEAAADGADEVPGHGHVPGHPYHACHHAHAHADAAWRAESVSLAATLVAVRLPTPAVRAQAPRSRAAEPEIRPPIA